MAPCPLRCCWAARQGSASIRRSAIRTYGMARTSAHPLIVAVQRFTEELRYFTRILYGADGKIVVDSFVQPAFPTLKRILDSMGNSPIRLLIDTHWHFDHTDNNANFHRAGATILAHENTKKHLSETHDVIGLHFSPAPQAALPTETFNTTHNLEANGEKLELGHFPPAHTDTDIYVHYTKANVPISVTSSSTARIRSSTGELVATSTAQSQVPNSA